MAGEGDRPESGPPKAAPGQARLVRTLPLIVGTLCAQGALLAAFLGGHLGTPGFVALHMATCGVVVCFGRLRRPDEAAMAIQLAAWTCLGGVFGSIMAAALLVPQGSAMVPALGADGDGAAVDRAGMTRLELLHGALLDGRLRISGAHTARPLLDVMLDGGQTEKFDALSLISKNYEPILAPALRRALEDRDGSVRVLAANVFAQLNNAHTLRIVTLQAAAVAAPAEAAEWRDLGLAHLGYAECGLLDAARAGSEAARAVEYLTRAIALDPADARLPDLLMAARRLSEPGRLRAVAIRIPDPVDESMVIADAA